MIVDPRIVAIISSMVFAGQLIEAVKEFRTFPLWKRATKLLVLTGTLVVVVLSTMNAIHSYLASVPRRLSADVQRDIADAIRADHLVAEVMCHSYSSEAQQFCEDMRRALDRGGWKTNVYTDQHPYIREQSAMYVSRDGYDPNTQLPAQDLIAVLRAHGFDVGASTFYEGRGASQPVPRDQIIVDIYDRSP